MRNADYGEEKETSDRLISMLMKLVAMTGPKTRLIQTRGFTPLGALSTLCGPTLVHSLAYHILP